MDRRQRKTREAIFKAFIELLAKKSFEQITVGEIIDCADVGRATFYAHFETKDFLLKELCEELFCHLFDSMDPKKNGHKHIFDCDAPDSAFLHLFQHLQKNDNNILELLSCKNNELFLQYFKSNLVHLVKSQISLFETRKNSKLPDSFWVSHITSTFVETVRWWVDNGIKESPEEITEYFFLAV
ncbi:MAG: TetR/AcrR family transcriptional regulator [Clostridia bacterium]|nr:TetR/AcrR family transcriptional regulator [Clostridia bacterium]MBQ9737720.1 TetR/AcrR family transcriptional regulator [Clostridia bacterium]